MPNNDKVETLEATADSGENEIAAISAALDVLDTTADRIIEAMDRNHALLQEAIEQMRSARAMVEESNGVAARRSGVFAVQ